MTDLSVMVLVTILTTSVVVLVKLIDKLRKAHKLILKIEDRTQELSEAINAANAIIHLGNNFFKDGQSKLDGLHDFVVHQTIGTVEDWLKTNEPIIANRAAKALVEHLKNSRNSSQPSQDASKH